MALISALLPALLQRGAVRGGPLTIDALRALRDDDAGGAALARPQARAAFLDKDGTLVENVPYNVDPGKLRLTPHAMEGLRLLQDSGFKLIVVTNQSGLARGYFDRGALNRLHAALSAMLREGGVEIQGYFVCPHSPAPSPLEPGCLCRKPAPGLLRQAALAHRVDLERSWMLGDILHDVEAGHRAGCRSVLLDVGNETEWRMSPMRTPDLRAPDLLAAAQAILAEPECPAGADGSERSRSRSGARSDFSPRMHGALVPGFHGLVERP